MGFEGGRGGFDRGPREMHKATCSDCGKETEIHKEDLCIDCYTGLEAAKEKIRAKIKNPSPPLNNVVKRDPLAKKSAAGVIATVTKRMS